jgi:hypothetical protein
MLEFKLPPDRVSPGRTPEGRTTKLDEPKDRESRAAKRCPRLHSDHGTPAAVMGFLATARDFLHARLLERSRNSRRRASDWASDAG